MTAVLTLFLVNSMVEGMRQLYSVSIRTLMNFFTVMELLIKLNMQFILKLCTAYVMYQILDFVKGYI